MRLGYSFTYNSQRNATSIADYGSNALGIRFNVESAGNVLYGFSNLFGASRNDQGQYTLFNIAYAQYLKGDFDISKSFRFDDRNSLALHFGIGVAYPYGNSTILPYEKRYFSGGANSVRGWSVRELGRRQYLDHSRLCRAARRTVPYAEFLAGDSRVLRIGIPFEFRLFHLTSGRRYESHSSGV